MNAEDKFKFIDVGNWWSGYRCQKCKEYVVVSDDADNPSPEAHHKCKEASDE